MTKNKLISLTVDALIIENESIVLIKRGNPPFKDSWALPGGFVEYGEIVEDAVVREAKEETGLDVKIIGLLGVYSDPERDPRGHSVSIVYVCMKKGGEVSGGSDAKVAKWFSLGELPEQLAFDHKKIIEDFKEKKKGGV